MIDECLKVIMDKYIYCDTEPLKENIQKEIGDNVEISWIDNKEKKMLMLFLKVYDVRYHVMTFLYETKKYSKELTGIINVVCEENLYNVNSLKELEQIYRLIINRCRGARKQRKRRINK